MTTNAKSVAANEYFVTPLRLLLASLVGARNGGARVARPCRTLLFEYIIGILPC